jgi:hypothetical protein
MTEGISEIKARYTDSGLTADEYKKLAISEIAQIRLDIKRVLKKYDELETENAALLEKLWEAVEDIRRIAPCSLCKHNGKQPCKNEDVGHEKCFEWRGETEEGKKDEA